MPAPDLIQKIFLPKVLPIQLPSTAERPPATWRHPFPPVLRVNGRTSKENTMGVSGYHTITHLTASPPAQEPRLGCSRREEGGGWGGTNQKPENRELPTSAVQALSQTAPTAPPRGGDDPILPPPLFPSPQPLLTRALR